MPLISVIVPAFRPRDLDGLRRSLDANADVDAEWIVVNDGSGQSFDAVFERLPAKVLVLREAENRRQGAARNVGLTAAQGDWIKFLDADDCLDEGHLSALLATTAQLDAIPFAPTRHVFPDGGSLVNDSWRGLESTAESQLARLLYAPFLSHCGALFPHVLLSKLGGYDENLVTDEDGDLLIRVLMTGAHFTAVEKVNYLYMHHQGGNRVSADVGEAKLASRLRVCEKVEAIYTAQDKEMPDAIRHGLAQRLDKIALSYWNENRIGAHKALAHARAICPDYKPEGRLPVRMLRALGGPSATKMVAGMYRRLRGRPAGGTQG